MKKMVSPLHVVVPFFLVYPMVWGVVGYVFQKYSEFPNRLRNYYL